jgi:hypothetical protein
MDVWMLSHAITALITVAAFLCATYYALKRRYLLAIICLGCFSMLIQPEVVLRPLVSAEKKGEEWQFTGCVMSTNCQNLTFNGSG